MKSLLLQVFEGDIKITKIGKKAHWTLLILLTGYICDVQYNNKQESNMDWVY